MSNVNAAAPSAPTSVLALQRSHIRWFRRWLPVIMFVAIANGWLGCLLLATSAVAEVSDAQWKLMQEKDPMAKSPTTVAFAQFTLGIGGTIEGKVFCDKTTWATEAVIVEMVLLDNRYIIKRHPRGFSYVPFRVRFDDLNAEATISLVGDYSNVILITFVPAESREDLPMGLIGVAGYPIHRLKNHKRLLVEHQLQNGKPVIEIDLTAPAIKAIAANCKL
jgi:hypothetical protein